MHNEQGGVAVVASQTEAEVLAYLRAHPDLLRRDAQLLAVLDLPHGVAGASSLIERQVKVLREANDALRRRLDLLVANARDNERVSARLHQLALALLAADSAAEALGIVYAALHEDFDADLATVRMFAAAPSREPGCGEYVGAAGASSAAIDGCIASARPTCGHLDAESLVVLFGERASQAASAALVPLSGVGVRGVLGIASGDAHRYSASAGTVFLRQLGELVTHALVRLSR